MIHDKTIVVNGRLRCHKWPLSLPLLQGFAPLDLLLKAPKGPAFKKMDAPSDLKIITEYKGHTLRNPYYTSRQKQQIYDAQKNIRTCDSHGYAILEVLDERNKFSGYRYAIFRRAALLKRKIRPKISII